MAECARGHTPPVLASALATINQRCQLQTRSPIAGGDALRCAAITTAGAGAGSAGAVTANAVGLVRIGRPVHRARVAHKRIRAAYDTPTVMFVAGGRLIIDPGRRI